MTRLIWPLLLSLLLGVVLSVAPAPGATAPRTVEVSGSVVRLRDLGAAVSGAKPADLDQVIVSGLRPGETRTLGAAEITIRLNELGIEGRVAAGTTVVVKRSARVLASAEIEAAGAKAVRERLELGPGDEASISPVSLPRSLLAPLGQVSFDASARRPTLSGGLWTVDIVAGLDDWEVTSTIRYRVRVTGIVLVTRRAAKRDEAITEPDVVQERCELAGLRGQVLRSADELTGRRAKRSVPAGTVLTDDWLERAPAVRRGDALVASARAGAVLVSMSVIALDGGSVGDTIRVRTATADREQTKTEFSARITSAGRVEVISP